MEQVKNHQFCHEIWRPSDTLGGWSFDRTTSCAMLRPVSQLLWRVKGCEDPGSAPLQPGVKSHGWIFFSCDVLKWNLSDWSELWSSCEISVISISHRIHGAGILMLTWLGYIDGIHGTPYIAAPWILWFFDSWLSVRVAILKSKRQRGHHQ